MQAGSSSSCKRARNARSAVAVEVAQPSPASLPADAADAEASSMLPTPVSSPQVETPEPLPAGHTFSAAAVPFTPHRLNAAQPANARAFLADDTVAEEPGTQISASQPAANVADVIASSMRSQTSQMAPAQPSTAAPGTASATAAQQPVSQSPVQVSMPQALKAAPRPPAGALRAAHKPVPPPLPPPPPRPHAGQPQRPSMQRMPQVRSASQLGFSQSCACVLCAAERVRLSCSNLLNYGCLSMLMDGKLISS